MDKSAYIRMIYICSVLISYIRRIYTYLTYALFIKKDSYVLHTSI